MMVTTKGRYALRVMLDLADNMGGEYITLKDIADRQEISEKYLESIISALSKAGFVSSLRGKGGGYKLTKKPEEYTVGSILRLVEGSIAPVSCVEKSPKGCNKANACRALPLWQGLEKVIDDYLDSKTLADIM